MSRKSPIGTAILFMASLAGAADAAAPVVLPMRPYGTQPAVEVMVNGKGPFLFMIDTGAGGRARLDKSVVDQLHIAPTRSGTASGATAQAAVPMTQVRVESLQLGTRRYAQVDALSRSYNEPGEYLPDIGGILAFGLFRDALLTIDFCHRQVRIADGALPPPDGRNVLAYEDRDGLPYVTFAVGDARGTALIDTGTDGALDLPLTMLRRLVLAAAPRPIGKARTVTGDIGIGAAVLEDPLVIGIHRFERIDATFSGAWLFPVLGSGLFHGYRLTFDQKNRRVEIVRPAGCQAVNASPTAPAIGTGRQ